MTDVLAQQHGHRASTALVQRRLQRAGNLVLAAILVAGHENGEALLAGKRVLLPQDLHNLGVREPGGDVLACPEAVAQLGTGDVHGRRSLRDLIAGHVLVAVGNVDHLLELDHLDAQLALVLRDQVLRIVRAVVVLAVLVLSRTGVVTTDDEVGGAVVLADNGVPDGLAGTGHAHGQGQQGQGGHAVGVARQQSLVDADTGEVVDVTGLSHTHDGVDEDIGLLRASGADGQLTVGTVHGVSGLEGHDLLPAQLVKVGSHLGRRDWSSRQHVNPTDPGG